MKKEIKIGEKEYQLPFKYSERQTQIVDSSGSEICYIFDHDEETEHALGQFIADALNRSADNWQEIKSKADLPKGIKLLWQFTNGNEYLIGIWDGTKVCGQFHTEFELIRFSAFRELPEPYKSEK